jgi:hypothetical protein
MSMTRHVIRCSLAFASLFAVLTLVFSFFNLSILAPLVRTLCLLEMLLVLAYIIGLLHAMRLARTKSPKWPRFRRLAVACLIFFVFFTVHFTALCSIISCKARREIRAFFSQVETMPIAITIGGHVPDDPDRVLAAIRNVRFLTRHRTQIINETECLIIAGDNQLTITIAQNASVPTQYWMYYPKYRWTSMNNIGGFYYDGPLLPQ